MPLFNTKYRLLTVCLVLAITGFELQAVSPPSTHQEDAALYQWLVQPAAEATRVAEAEVRLQEAIHNPEYVLKKWVELPISPAVSKKALFHLSLRDAILLSLRYNPNIQNSELDRIIQRYQLRLAHNEFELQYALAGSASIEKSHFSGVGNAISKTYIASPELGLKTKAGTNLSLKIDNNVSAFNNYTPVLNFSLNQPLLRGFGVTANEANLLNAIDSEWLNKVNLQQAVMDQITEVIMAYRALILSGNNLANQQAQLQEAQKSYTINEKKMEAGQLEPTGNIQQSYQIESLRLMLEQAEIDFKTRTQDLLQTIGLDPTMRIAVPSDLALSKERIPTERQALAIALAHNNQYLALKMALRADERAYQVAKNQQRWQLDVGANVQTGNLTDVEGNNTGLQGIYNGRNTIESARVTLTVPLNDINRRSQLINAKVQLEKDRINIMAMKRALMTSITNTLATIKSQTKQYELALKQVTLARQSYDLEKQKKAAGISTSLDVNNTQNQLIQAQASLISAKVAYLNQVSALARLLGTTLDEWHIKLRYGQ